MADLGPIVQCKVTAATVNYPCNAIAGGPCDPACAPGSTAMPTLKGEWGPPLRLGGNPEQDAEADILDWVKVERLAYAHQKWAPPAAEAAHRASLAGTGPTRWEDWAGDYIKRASMFGLDTPQGRQALGKAISTLVHFLATAVVDHGPMPRPGVPSGVIE